MMETNVKEKFPEWCNDTVNNYNLCLTDDLDSLFSCAILNKLKGYEISHFYNFSGIGTNGKHNKQKQVIGVDMDLIKGQCWGNHVTMLSPNDTYNKNCANVNNALQISRENYTDKFCGSTVLQILSYYDIDISKLSKEGQMILLAIDAGYAPFYSSFKRTGTKWLSDILGYPELVELTNKYSKKDFLNINDKYKLYEKIHIKGGYLTTNINLAELSEIFLLNLELPKQKFNLKVEFSNVAVDVPKNNTDITKADLFPKNDVVSLAVTRKNFINFSKVYNRK